MKPKNVHLFKSYLINKTLWIHYNMKACLKYLNLKLLFLKHTCNKSRSNFNNV